MKPKIEELAALAAIAADISLKLDELDAPFLSLKNWATWAILEHPEIREYPHPISKLLISAAIAHGLHLALKGQLNDLYLRGSSLAYQYPPEEEEGDTDIPHFPKDL